MSEPLKTSDEFAAAMQQLSAEAQKTLRLGPGEDHPGGTDALSKLVWEVRGLGTRLESLEGVLTNKNDNAAAASAGAPADFAQRLEKMDESLTAIRGSESVNQKLFDTLHAELLNYRDNFLHESLQKPFIHDLVLLYDDLNGLAEQLRRSADEQKKRGHVAQWRDNLDNAIHSLVEILHRFEVKEVEPREFLDRCRSPGCQLRAGRFCRRRRANRHAGEARISLAREAHST